jgi:steroid delta-isomerase
MTATGPEKTVLREIIERYLAACETGDARARGALFAEAAIFEDPVGQLRLEGAKDIRAFFENAPSGMRLVPRLINIVECGREAIFHYHMTISGWQPDPVCIEVDELISLDAEDKIVSLRAFWNAGSITPA